MKRFAAFASFIFASAVFCAAQTGDVRYGIFRQEGVASWYGSEFAGRSTASGEIFDPSHLTAAHQSLPFGTMLRVTNRQNNRQVTVRVNDRGPYTTTRIIDLSRAAAEQLDMLGTGMAQVLIESLSQIAFTPVPAPGQGTSQSPAVRQGYGQTSQPGVRGPYYDAELGGTVLDPLDGPAPIISRSVDTYPQGQERAAALAQTWTPPSAQIYQSPQGSQTAQMYQQPQNYQSPPQGYMPPADPAATYHVIPGPVIVYQSAPVQTWGGAQITAPQAAPVPQAAPAPPPAPPPPVQAYYPAAQAQQPAQAQTPQPPPVQAPPGQQASQTAAPVPPAPVYYPAAQPAQAQPSQAQPSQAQPASQAAAPPAARSQEAPAPSAPAYYPAAQSAQAQPSQAQPASQAAAPPAARSQDAHTGPALILPAMPPTGTGKTYRVQAGSFRTPRNAVDAFERLKNAGLSPAYERNGDYYRVVLAGLRPEEIPQVAEKLGVAGFREALIREE